MEKLQSLGFVQSRTNAIVLAQKLFDHAKSKNIKIFSTPFSEEAIDILEEINCPAYKIASFEMNDYNLIKSAAKTKKPLIISTGMSDLNEIGQAVKIAKKFGCKDLTLLYCVSNYPSNSYDFNLNFIRKFKEEFSCKVGLSDHSLGSEVARYSLIAGATVFEKHIALPNQKKGLDLKFSLKGNQLKKYCEDLRKTNLLINNKNLKRTSEELTNKVFRRSIYAIKDIVKGDIFTKNNIRTFRPNKGLSASFYIDILKKKISNQY